jgi:hypothetical protein
MVNVLTMRPGGVNAVDSRSGVTFILFRAAILFAVAVTAAVGPSAAVAQLRRGDSSRSIPAPTATLNSWSSTRKRAARRRSASTALL